jgi:hypothetical protein
MLFGCVLAFALVLPSISWAEQSSLTGRNSVKEQEDPAEGEDDELLDDIVGVEEEDDDRPRRRAREEDDDTDEPSWMDDDRDDHRDGGRRGRLSPSWFYASLGMTLAVGAGTLITGVLALRLNRLYLEEQSDWLLRERGMGLQTTTNIFIGVTSAFALATVLLGIFTDWSGGRDSADDDDDDDEDDDDDDDDERAGRLPQHTLDQLLARSLERRL